MNEAIIWARVSTDEQKKYGWSPDEQVRYCSDYAKINKYEIIKTWSESETGKGERKKFFGMIDWVIDNGCPTILIKERDRYGRSQKDNEHVLELTKKHPFKIIFCNDNSVLEDGMMPEKKFVHNVQVEAWELHIGVIRAKTKAGLLEKARQGWLPSFAPIGYKNHSISNEHRDRKGNIIIVDEKNKNFPVTLFKLYSTGNYSFALLCEEMNKRGYKNRYGNPVTKRLVQSTLKNIFYTGLFKFNDEIFEGNHPPLIDKSLFDKVQEIIGNNVNAKIKTKRSFVYRRVIKCGECGRSLVGEIQNGAHNSGTYIYYRCRNSSCYQDLINEKILDSVFHKELDKLKIDKDMKDWATKVLRNSISDDKEKTKSRLYHLKSEEKKIINRKDILLNNLLDNLVAGSGFTSTEIKAKANQLQNQLIDIRQQIKKLEKSNDGYIDQGIALLNLVSNIKKNFLKLETKQKSDVLNILFKKCPVNDGKIKINWNPPFSYISELVVLNKKG